jgi:hypothetical protein
MRKIHHIIIISALFLVGCAVMPTLTPINLHQVDIEKDGKIYFELTDSHTKVVKNNSTNFPGIHNDIDENKFLPLPFVEYLEKNIISNLRKSPGVELLDLRDGNEFYINFNLQHFNVYRETSSFASLAKFIPIIYLLMGSESCSAEIKGVLMVSNQNTNDILCNFNLDIKETVQFRHIATNDLPNAYANATQQASSKLIEQIISGLMNC